MPIQLLFLASVCQRHPAQFVTPSFWKQEKDEECFEDGFPYPISRRHIPTSANRAPGPSDRNTLSRTHFVFPRLKAGWNES